MQTDHELLEENYKLARDNNKMLHAMRRSAWIGGIIKIILYAALIFGPLWLYAHYVMPVLGSLQQELAAIQHAGGQAKADFSSLQNILSQLQHIPGFSAGTPDAR